MNKFKLEYEMREKGVNITSLAHELHISRSALYRKLNGKSEFTLSEVQHIVDFLGLKSPVEIFFPAKSVLKDTLERKPYEKAKTKHGASGLQC